MATFESSQSGKPGVVEPKVPRGVIPGFAGYTIMSGKERECLSRRIQDLPRGSRILEIGTGDGVTIALLAKRHPSHQFVSVDSFAGSMTSVHHFLFWWINRRPNQVLLFSDSSLCTEILREGFALAIVDGGHDRDTCSEDLQQAVSLLRPGGVLVAHDYVTKHPRLQGVVEAVDEFLQKSDYSVVETAGSMAVFLEASPGDAQ